MPHNVGFMEIGQTGWIRKVEFDPKGDCYVNKHDRVSELHDPKYGYYTKIEKLDTGYKVTAEKRYDIYICKNIDKDIKSPYFVKATFHEGFKLFIELKDMEIGRAYWTNNEALREDEKGQYWVFTYGLFALKQGHTGNGEMAFNRDLNVIRFERHDDGYHIYLPDNLRDQGYPEKGRLVGMLKMEGTQVTAHFKGDK